MATAKHRLYYNSDRTELVHEGDPDAAFLAAGVGDDIPEGMKAPSGKPPEADADAEQAIVDAREEDERVAKMGHVPANKQAREAANKAATA